MSAGMPALTASVKAQLLLRLVDLEPASCLMTGGRFWPDGAIDAGMSRLVCPSLAKSLANQNLWKDMLARLEFKIGKWHCIAGLNLNVMERKKINFFLELDVWSFQSNRGSFQHLCQPLMTWQEGQGGYILNHAHLKKHSTQFWLLTSHRMTLTGRCHQCHFSCGSQLLTSDF